MHDTADLSLIDRKLLAALQRDGGLTNQELAEVVGLSPSQCSRRRLALEEAGVICGYRALIDRRKAGFGVSAIIDVTLNTHSGDNARRFNLLVGRLPEVRKARALTGEMDYQLEVVVRSLDDLAELINEQLLPDQSVQTVKSSIVLQTLKDIGGLPLDAENASIRRQ